MTLNITGRGTIKTAPKDVSFEKDGRTKVKIQAVLEFEPFAGARNNQSILLEGWGENKKLFKDLQEGDYVTISGVLNHVSKKDAASGRYNTFTSINVDSLS